MQCGRNRQWSYWCRNAINWGLRHFACLRQAASNPNTRTKHRNLAKRLARERAARIIAGAGQFAVRYQWRSANTNSDEHAKCIRPSWVEIAA